MNDRIQAVFWTTTSILAGAVVIYIGDQLIGVKLELFWGISTFSPLWLLDLLLVPLIGGIVVASIYGLGGKLMCYFSPLIVRSLSYWEMSQATTLPEGASLLPIGYWGFVVIVSIEAAAVGGVIGEVIIKKIYGRRPKGLYYKQTDKRPRVTEVDK